MSIVFQKAFFFTPCHTRKYLKTQIYTTYLIHILYIGGNMIYLGHHLYRITTAQQ